MHGTTQTITDFLNLIPVQLELIYATAYASSSLENHAGKSLPILRESHTPFRYAPKSGRSGAKLLADRHPSRALRYGDRPG